MSTRPTTAVIIMAGILISLAACGPTFPGTPWPRPADLAQDQDALAKAHALMQAGEPLQAIGAYRALLRVNGPSLAVLNGLAIAYAELGRPDLATDYFARALAHAPEDSTTLNNIGYAALRRREAGLARLYLEKAQAAGGGTQEIHGNLAMLERLETRLGRWPRHEESRQALAHPSAADMARPTIWQKDAVTGRWPVPQAETRTPMALIKNPVVPAAQTDLIDFDDLYDPWAVSPGLE